MQKHVPLGLFFLSSLAHSLFYWLLSSVISKARGTAALGELSFFLSMIGPVSIIAGLQLKNYYLSKKIGNEWREILFLRLIFSNVVFLIFLFLILITQPALYELAISLTAMKASESWSELCQMRWQKKNQLIKTSLSLLVRYATSILICSYFLLFDSSIQIYFILALVGIIFAVLDTLADPFNLTEWSKSLPILKTVFKLSMSALFTSLLINLPRYLLKNFHGDDSLGIFSAMFYFYVIPTMLINIGLQGVAHQLTAVLNKGLIRVGSILIFICSLLVLCSLHFFGPEFMRTIYAIEFQWNVYLTILITASFFFGSLNTLFQYSLLGLNIYHVQLVTSFVAFVLAALLGFLLVPSYGIFGAFTSFLSGLLVQSLLYSYFYLKSSYG
jgi:O-antigen/teichoic acid export membrane protein